MVGDYYVCPIFFGKTFFAKFCIVLLRMTKEVLASLGVFVILSTTKGKTVDIFWGLPCDFSLRFRY